MGRNDYKGDQIRWPSVSGLSIIAKVKSRSLTISATSLHPSNLRAILGGVSLSISHGIRTREAP